METEPLSDDINMTVSSEIEGIVRSLVANDEVIFKSQQRGESEPNEMEKTDIALAIFNKNKTSFLMKFGRYLNEQQLQFFNQYASEDSEPADYQEIRIVLDSLKLNLQTNGRNIQVKNRR